MNFKVFTIFIAFALMAIASDALPNPQEQRPVNLETEPRGSSQPENFPELPQQYITCDIIGSNALCAVHCIGRGFKGGYCNDKKVCVCRN
ncbi:U-Asilidin(12)-Dg3b-like [Sitodiplosis mosellana]|uniref:U-Asilidin(12)-Dg3b-like n=1 Tax=Sitodiplosis mosellana TaxID=263140 RepID=UPI002444D7CB|nr:U-Asilidin(12)-Dg3b-like [Sitodiplosis mosellana]